LREVECKELGFVFERTLREELELPAQLALKWFGESPVTSEMLEDNVYEDWDWLHSRYCTSPIPNFPEVALKALKIDGKEEFIAKLLEVEEV